MSLQNLTADNKAITTQGEQFSLGDRNIFVSVNNFQGELKIHVRKYFQQGDQLFPTKNGVTLRLSEWRKLQQHAELIEQSIKRRQIEQERESSNAKQLQPSRDTELANNIYPDTGYYTSYSGNC